MNHPKRVAIIGAGGSGLAAIKCCKEVGLEPVCFERNGDPGGLWLYRDDDVDGVASVMKTTITNTGKEKSSFSDFPPPPEFPNYMHNSVVFDYLMLYARNFDLLRHIRYHSEVLQVEKTSDHDATGRWSVSVRSSQRGEVTSEEFDAVLVCIGHHVYPKVPRFPGQEKFRGVVAHSHSVKSCESYAGKKVAVVGIGNSGGDVAVDCSFVAKTVYLSTRRGSWIFSRMGMNGRPLDMDFDSRAKVLLSSFKSYDSICQNIENDLNRRFDHEAYKLKPKHRVLSAHPTLNDFLPNCILSGRVVVKGDIQRFEEDGVVFENEGEVTEVNAVILATGYLIRFPFLGETLRTEDNKVDLYKYVIPPALKHSTLAMIGLIQPVGSIFPVSEMQCRWFVQTLMGNVKLPTVRDMLKEIKAKNEANSKRFIDSTRHTIQIDWMSYMDELSSQIGAKPNLLKMAVIDPRLFLACFNGPCLPYQYRLQGPQAWKGARDTILNYEKRVFSALNSDGKGISKNLAAPRGREVGSKKMWLLVLFLSGTVVVKRHFVALYQALPPILVTACWMWFDWTVLRPFNFLMRLVSKALDN